MAGRRTETERAEVTELTESCSNCGAELDDSADHLTIRGDHYILRDLDAGEYEAVVRRATPPPENGEIQDPDMLLLRKFLVIDATTKNGKPLDIGDQAKMPHPVYAKLDTIARRRHWGEIESDEERAAREAAAAAKVPSR